METNIEAQEPLISIIVPIYNVEKYVRKCLDSLKSQTMKEIEVICIDDGSTDRSGEIADEYASDVYPIFHIIHTENRGLSAARNRGIDEARGGWLMFVDSDDWVEREFCEIPYEKALEYGADLVIFRAFYERNCRRIKKNNCEIHGLINEYTAHTSGGVVAWNKLYEKSLFEKIRYPEARVYEDIATTHKIVHIAKRIYVLNECLYHQVYRKNSISHINTRKV